MTILFAVLFMFTMFYIRERRTHAQEKKGTEAARESREGRL